MEDVLNTSSPFQFNISQLYVHQSSLLWCTYNAYETPMTLSIFIVSLLFLMPLYLRVLQLVHARRSRSVAVENNSDIFAVHMIVMEMTCFFAFALYLIGLSLNQTLLMLIAMLCYNLSATGKPLFHCCTCIERYLAVVHPITYLRLRSGGGKLRQVASGCVWLLCFGWVGLLAWYLPDYPNAVCLSIHLLTLLIISFCCLSVLRALIRPGPGDGSGDRKMADQSKQRAFWTITAILGALAVNIVVFVILYILKLWANLSKDTLCLGFDINVLFSLPSGAVQPVLFLHSAGKLPGFRHSEG